MTTATAWYIIPSTNIWARWFNTLHWPYTLWHLSYVVIGASLANGLSWPLLGWTVLAFFLGMGIGAHALDLVKGDPLKQGLNPVALYIVAAVALALACTIGARQWALGNVSPWLWIAISLGIVFAAGYNLEWPGLHGDWQFAAWWAVFPFLVGYFAQGIDFSPVVAMMAVFLFVTALVQRILSTRVRYLRRQVGKATVTLETWHEGQQEWLFGAMELKPWLLAPDEKALAWLSAGMALLAVAGLLLHI